MDIQQDVPKDVPIDAPTKTGNKKWIIVLIILILAGAVLYFLINKKSASSTEPMTQTYKIYTEKEFLALPVALDEANGYHIGGAKDGTAKPIIDSLVEDNSRSNPTYLYWAANSALFMEDIKSAGFLMYAARIRAAFDMERFNLKVEDDKSVVAYWRTLEEKIGPFINPEIVRNPVRFNEIADMIEAWDPLPADDAFYPKGQYGEPVMDKAEWAATAKAKKQWYIDNYFNKFKKLLSNPKYSEALNFVNDYTMGNIPRSEENEPKYVEYLKVLSKALSENGLGH